MKRLLLCSLLLILNTISATQSVDEYRILDEIALKTGADKGSDYHNYTEIYAKYLSPLRDAPIKFLEIGIYKACSVKMWEEYLKKAELHFMDITFDNAEYFSDRSHYHLCNQESAPELISLIEKIGGNFDIILDDGGHTMNQQSTSFKVLFPHVKSGGMYIIEDLHTSYWQPHFGGGGPNSMVNFLKSLVDEVNYVGATTAKASHLNIDTSGLSSYQKNIESIHFYDSIAIIIKR